ncbi:MAG: hypothetical protein AAGH79_15900 [Bacteroidota bacterium]
MQFFVLMNYLLLFDNYHPSDSSLYSIFTTMRIFWSLILLFQVLLITFQEGTFYLIFKINQDYLAENVCEERFQPKSCCEGICTLRKVIEQAREEPSTEKPATIPTLDREPIHFLQPTQVLISPVCCVSGQPPSRLVSWNAVFFKPSLLRPPMA